MVFVPIKLWLAFPNYWLSASITDEEYLIFWSMVVAADCRSGFHWLQPRALSVHDRHTRAHSMWTNKLVWVCARIRRTIAVHRNRKKYVHFPIERFSFSDARVWSIRLDYRCNNAVCQSESFASGQTRLGRLCTCDATALVSKLNFYDAHWRYITFCLWNHLRCLIDSNYVCLAVALHSILSISHRTHVALQRSVYFQIFKYFSFSRSAVSFFFLFASLFMGSGLMLRQNK